MSTAPYSSYSGHSPAPIPYDDTLAIAPRATNRTPSPTPSEIEALSQTGLINIRPFFRKDRRFSQKNLLYYAIAIVVIVFGALLVIYDKQIVHAIQPAANWMHKTPGGWLIPIVIFFIISFPPLFGHEILAIVCGLVWGIWVGFAITAAGTLLGEIGNFYAFRYLLRSHAEKLETTNILYACLAKIIREGGFKIALIVRYSFVPGHFTTAIFSVCGMNIFVFILAAVLSMPKQFITVYIGTLMESTASGTKPSTTNQIANYAVTGITIVVTVAAMWYIRREVNRVKPDVIYARRKARQAKAEPYSSFAQSAGSAVFNPNESDVNLLNSSAPSDSPYTHYQQWDRDGRAMGYATDPQIFVPQPRRANAASSPQFVASSPSPTRSATSPHPTRQGTTDSSRWAQQMNAADGQAYPLHSIPDTQRSEVPLENPFDNTSADADSPPREPIQVPSPSRSYAFTQPHHSFSANASNLSERGYPPSYRS